MNIDDWKSQIKRGTLEFCILLLIKQESSYGYEIISTLDKYPIIAAKENTIYPLLHLSESHKGNLDVIFPFSLIPDM